MPALKLLRKVIHLECIYGIHLFTIILLYPFLVAYSIFYSLYRLLRKCTGKKSIKGEVALVTGSGGGLGRFIAIALAARGCHVAIVDIQGNLAKETAEYICCQYKVKTKAYQIDVSDYQQLLDLRTKVTNDLGDVTILVNNAGILALSNAENSPPDEIRQMVNVNLTAMLYTLQIFLPRMKELNRGHIANIGSITALLANPSYHVYGATKAAVRQLTSSLRIDLMYNKYQITATTLMPTFLTTNRQVHQLWTGMKGERLLPCTDGDVVAEHLVCSMLNGDCEVTVPRVFLYIFNLYDLLPITVKEQIATFVMALNIIKFKSPDVKRFLQNKIKN